MTAEVVSRIWALFHYGSACSAGYGHKGSEHAPGSGYIFAYGHTNTEGETNPAVHIHNAEGEERTLEPATQENVLEALTQMGITETEWSI